MTNIAIELVETKLLSNNWYTLQKITYRIQKRNGKWAQQSREVYDRGNGATLSLYNLEQQTIILTKQFRLPTYVNGNTNGLLIETCAGLLDQDNPEDCIRREVREETDYEITQPVKIFEAYMSPGSVTEILYFFIAEYSAAQQVATGGGVDEEDIEVIEMKFTDAMQAIHTGNIKDGKTIMLLQYAALNLFADKGRAS